MDDTQMSQVVDALDQFVEVGEYVGSTQTGQMCSLTVANHPQSGNSNDGRGFEIAAHRLASYGWLDLFDPPPPIASNGLYTTDEFAYLVDFSTELPTATADGHFHLVIFSILGEGGQERTGPPNGASLDIIGKKGSLTSFQVGIGVPGDGGSVIHSGGNMNVIDLYSCGDLKKAN
jgi:hypothetical protein